jgi:hypothetical protein
LPPPAPCIPVPPIPPLPEPRTQPAGLVGAWSFDESTGKSVLDSSGNLNHGTVSGASRTAGKFGNALQFDGVNDMVTVADADSLDLTEAMTLEAWVKPTALGSMWRTVVIKEQSNQLAYALYAGNGNSRPSGHVYTTGDRAVAGSTALQKGKWAHLASTWDGTTLRLYVNGRQVAKAPLRPSAVRSGRVLRFGGNAVWPEWFKGAIDEVRIYNRALSPQELEADRNTAVSPTRTLTSNRVRTGIRTDAAKANKKPARRKAHRRAARHKTRWMR